MFRSNKRQHIEKSPQGVFIRTWLRVVQEYGYVLVNIETNTATTPMAKSLSVMKAKLAALEIRLNLNNADIEEILDDIPRGEQNINLTEKQYPIQWPSFGLAG